jgi:hypothetical protein
MPEPMSSARSSFRIMGRYCGSIHDDAGITYHLVPFPIDVA